MEEYVIIEHEIEWRAIILVFTLGTELALFVDALCCCLICRTKPETSDMETP